MMHCHLVKAYIGPVEVLGEQLFSAAIQILSCIAWLFSTSKDIGRKHGLPEPTSHGQGNERLSSAHSNLPNSPRNPSSILQNRNRMDEESTINTDHALDLIKMVNEPHDLAFAVQQAAV